MSIIQYYTDQSGQLIIDEKKLVPEGEAQSKITPDKLFSAHPLSAYTMTDDERLVRGMILKHFWQGDQTMNRPRVELNDMSVLQRMMYDQMSWNVYQPNNGEPNPGDQIQSWRSNAKRPIIRNKCVSIAAHATAKLIFPKIFAHSDNEENKEAAIVMSDLVEYSADQSDYSYFSLMRVITALTDPCSIGYTEYAETYRDIKTKKNKDGKWETKRICDEEMSGFQNVVVPTNELYIENIYEPNIQKQGWLIWRKTLSYSLAEQKYKDIYANFKYVTPGMQVLYNDANNSFYQVYDSVMRQDMVEEIIYWNRNLDLKVIMVNGVMLTDSDNPNPRLDKQYPFEKFGYEIINNKFFYYKSLAFKLMQDDKIVNDMYQMIIDGSMLQVFPSYINKGGEAITSDIVGPGYVTSFSDPNASLEPLQVSNNGRGLQAGFQAMNTVMQDVNDSSEQPLMQGQAGQRRQTAYEMSRLEQNANTVLGLFIKMISQFVKDFGKLRVSDILQYMTIANVDDVEGGSDLTYKTFLLPERGESSNKTKKIKFKLPSKDKMTKKEVEKESFRIYSEQGGEDKEMYLVEVNPILFRELKYKLSITPDIINPKSEDLKSAEIREMYDRMVQNPLTDPEEAYRFLLSSSSETKRNPDKFIKKQDVNQLNNPLDMAMQQGNKPSNIADTLGATRKLPQTMAQ